MLALLFSAAAVQASNVGEKISAHGIRPGQTPIGDDRSEIELEQSRIEYPKSKTLDRNWCLPRRSHVSGAFDGIQA